MPGSDVDPLVTQCDQILVNPSKSDQNQARNIVLIINDGGFYKTMTNANRKVCYLAA